MEVGLDEASLSRFPLFNVSRDFVLFMEATPALEQVLSK